MENKVDGVPERRKFGRMKLLQFSENHRPAYWGTWNKKTAVIRPRDPWAQDKVSPEVVIPIPGVGVVWLCATLCHDAHVHSPSRTFLTMKWTVMMNGKRRNLGSLCPTAKG